MTQQTIGGEAFVCNYSCTKKLISHSVQVGFWPLLHIQPLKIWRLEDSVGPTGKSSNSPSSCTNFAVSFGSLSCWKVHQSLILIFWMDGCRFLSRMSSYMAPFSSPLTICIQPVPCQVHMANGLPKSLSMRHKICIHLEQRVFGHLVM